jgi:glucan 1,4-alpha-maltotetraohydrolase
MSARGNGQDIILQAFHWNLVKTQGTGTIDGRPDSWYSILFQMVEKIAAFGYTVVYLPPSWRDDSSWDNNGKHGGGEGYFWHDFDLNSRYGTKAELTGLVSKFHALGIKVIVDLVTNHRDHSHMERDIWPYPGPHWAKGGVDCGGSFMDGSADLALDHPEVSSRIVAAMDELTNDCGIDGWRWDYVWGYSVKDVVDWINSSRCNEYLSIGEYWQSSPTLTNDPMVRYYGPDEGTRILGWTRDSGGLAFDILLKRQINTADPANLKLGLNTRPEPEQRSEVVTFVDNHDMGESPYSPANGWGQQCWPCPQHFKSKAYAFILSMPGTPCVYWPDCFDWGHGEEIASLITARKKAGITASSEWCDLTGEFSGFAGIVKNGQGKDALALSIGSNYLGPGQGWSIAAQKLGEWTVWVKDQ